MSEREKPAPSPATTPSIDPDLFAQLNALPPQDENGVDLSMIDWMLSLTPAQRIERNYQARLLLQRSRGVDR